MPTVTPGYTFVADEEVTYAKLNAAAAPLVAFTPEDHEEIAEVLVSGSRTINWFANPDFRTWSNGTTLALPSGQWVELADRWEAEGTYTDGAGGGTGGAPAPTTYITHRRAADAAHDHVIYCAEFVGEPNGAAARIGQRLSAQVAAAMLENKATLTIEVENKTGATQTVMAYFESCSTFENYASTIERWQQSLGTVANNERKTITQEVDLSGLVTHVRNGGRIFVRLPGLSAGSKSWLFYYAKLEPGPTATPRYIERDPVQESAASTAAEEGFEYIRNGDFTDWISKNIGCPEDVDTVAAAGWVIVPADGAVVADRFVGSPDVKTELCVRITGDGGVGEVDFGQDIAQRVAALLRDEVVFAISIYNGTGVAFTPEFVLDTFNTGNDSSARTNRITQPLSLCSNGAWTRISWAFNGSLQTNMVNGARLSIRIPSGSLDDPGKTVRFAQGSLRHGTAAAEFVAEPTRRPLDILRGGANQMRGLRIERSGTTTILVTIGGAVLERADGALTTLRNIVQTINISSTGLNGLDQGTATALKWYLVYLVSDDRDAVGAILHREDNADGALKLPAGCRWYSNPVGAVRLNGIGQVPEFVQLGEWVCIERAIVNDAFPAVADTWEQLSTGSVATAIPDIATAVKGSVGASSNTNLRMAISPAGSSVGELSVHLSNETNTYNGFRAGAVPFELPLFAAKTLWVKAESTLHKLTVFVSAFRMP